MMDTNITEKFSRESLAGYDPATLNRSRVALVGVGALGQNAAMALALSGVGQLAVVDHDWFEETNRTRSPNYAEGASKAVAAALGFGKLSTASSASAWYYHGLVQEVGDLVVEWADVVVSAVDSLVGRAYLAERCRIYRTPLVEGGFDTFDLSFSTFRNAHAHEACWRCGRGALDDGFERGLCTLYARHAEKAGIIPAVQSVAQATGAAVAEAAIAALHGEFPLAGKRWTMNLRTGHSVLARLPIDPECLGIHEALDGVPTQLDISADDKIEALVAAVNQEFNGMHWEAQLPAPFVERLPCRRCGRSVLVDRPIWAVDKAPECPDGCEVRSGDSHFHPSSLSFISPDNQEVMAHRCRTMGLGSGVLFQVTTDRDRRWFKVAGDFQSTFHEVTPLPVPESGPELQRRR